MNPGGRRGGKTTAPAGGTVMAAKPAVGHLQTAEARRDRATQAKDRQQQAKALLSYPKPVRQAIQVAKIAQREGYAGAGKSMAKAGLGKKPSTAFLSDIQEGRLRLLSDFGKRKGKMPEGYRQAIYRTMINSGNVLRGRLRITAAGARIRGMGGARRVMASSRLNTTAPDGTVKKNSNQ